MQVRVGVCIWSERGRVCVSKCEKGGHFIHCRQVVSKSNC